MLDAMHRRRCESNRNNKTCTNILYMLRELLNTFSMDFLWKQRIKKKN